MKYFAVLLAMLLVSVCGYAAPEEDLLKVTMQGRAAGTDGAARNEAIVNAEREIILQAIESILPKPDLTILRGVLDHIPRYIVQSPRLMKHDVGHDSVSVEIEAQVRNDVLRRDIAQCVLPHLRPPRKALALIAEQAPDGALTTAKAGPAENAITDALRAIGLDVSNSAEVRAIYEGVDLLPRIQGDTQGMALLARENLADIIIAGTATMTHEAASSGANVQVCHALISISIVRAADGKMVESKGVEAIVNSVNPAEGDAQAMEDACAKLKKDIGVPAVLAAAGSTPDDAVIVSIATPPPGEFAKDLLGVLRAKDGVQTADILLQTRRIVRLRAAYSGTMESLVDDVVSKTYAGVRLEPKRVVGNRMELEVVGK